MSYIDFGGYRLPTYSADQLRWNAPQEQWANSLGDSDTAPFISGYSPATLSFLGQYDPSIANLSNSSNWALQPILGMKQGDGGAYEDALTKDYFTGMLKTGDKEGTIFKYGLKDGQYVPVEELGKQHWDTNFRGASLAALAAAAILTGGAAAAGMLGGGAGAGGAAAGAGGAGATGGWTGLGLLDGAAAGIGSGAGGWVTSLGGAASAGLPITGEFLGPATNTVANPYNPALGASGASGASGLSSLLSNPNALRVGSTLLGGLLGSGGSGSGGGGAPGGPTPATNVPVPQMYGGNTSGFNGGLFNMGPQGNTQTEAMMRSYLPSLFGGAGIARTDIPQQSAKASLQDAFWPRYWS